MAKQRKKRPTPSLQYYLSVLVESFANLATRIEPTVREVPTMIYKLNEVRKNAGL